MDELSDHIPKRRQRRRRKHLAGGLITSLIVAVIGFVFTAPPQAKQAVLQAQPGLWHVAKAVDGDTLHVTQGAQKETVRLLGVDTPETHDPRKPVQCFGLAAATHTKATLEGQNVRLEPDPTNSDRDKYGRLLRYVYLPDGTLFNAELVRDGYAFAYVVFPLAKLEEFRALEREARDQNRGLWAGCAINDTTKIKQTAGSK